MSLAAYAAAHFSFVENNTKTPIAEIKCTISGFLYSNLAIFERVRFQDFVCVGFWI